MGVKVPVKAGIEGLCQGSGSRLKGEAVAAAGVRRYIQEPAGVNEGLVLLQLWCPRTAKKASLFPRPLQHLLLTAPSMGITITETEKLWTRQTLLIFNWQGTQCAHEAALDEALGRGQVHT